jgi:hypothetical protein
MSGAWVQRVGVLASRVGCAGPLLEEVFYPAAFMPCY